MPVRTYTFDAHLLLAASVGAGTQAAGPAQVEGSPKVLDVYGGQFEGMITLQIKTQKVSAGDERYLIILQGSNSPTFSSGVENLAVLELGAAAARFGGAAVSTTGRRFLGAVNEVDDTIYRYLRLFNVYSGTAPSLDYFAYLSAMPGH